MKAENRKLLVEALRSGEYKQGTNCLLDTDDEFCCLGVAIDVLVDTDWVYTSGGYYPAGTPDEFVYNIDLVQPKYDNRSMPSPKILESMGISQEEATAWASMNDAGYTFEEISYYIERGEVFRC